MLRTTRRGAQQRRSRERRQDELITKGESVRARARVVCTVATVENSTSLARLFFLRGPNRFRYASRAMWRANFARLASELRGRLAFR